MSGRRTSCWAHLALMALSMLGPGAACERPAATPPEPGAEFERRHVVGLVHRTLARIDGAAREIEAWNEQVTPLLESDEGRVITRVPELVAEFERIHSRRRPSREDVERARQRAEALAAAVAESGNVPPDAIVEALLEDGTWAEQTARDFANDRAAIESLKRQATVRPLEGRLWPNYTLAEAIEVVRNGGVQAARAGDDAGDSRWRPTAPPWPTPRGAAPEPTPTWPAPPEGDPQVPPEASAPPAPGAENAAVTLIERNLEQRELRDVRVEVRGARLVTTGSVPSRAEQLHLRRLGRAIANTYRFDYRDETRVR